MAPRTARDTLISFVRSFSMGQAYHYVGLAMRAPKEGVTELAKAMISLQLGALKSVADECCEKCQAHLELRVRGLDEALNSFDDEAKDDA